MGLQLPAGAHVSQTILVVALHMYRTTLCAQFDDPIPPLFPTCRRRLAIDADGDEGFGSSRLPLSPALPVVLGPLLPRQSGGYGAGAW